VHYCSQTVYMEDLDKYWRCSNSITRKHFERAKWWRI
jgi:hypothetical protein